MRLESVTLQEGQLEVETVEIERNVLNTMVAVNSTSANSGAVADDVKSMASKASKAKSYKSDVVMASWFPLKVIRRLGKERLAEVGLDYKPSFGEWNLSDMNESPWG